MIFNALELEKIQQATKLIALTPHQAGNKIFFAGNFCFGQECKVLLKCAT
jgi:hypothetical protein